MSAALVGARRRGFLSPYLEEAVLMARAEPGGGDADLLLLALGEVLVPAVEARRAASMIGWAR